MSNTFEFAEKFGFSPPFNFEENEEKTYISNEKTIDAHLRIVFPKTPEAKEGIYQVSSKDFLVVARKNKDLELKKYQTNNFTTTGLTYHNITNIYQVVLGEDLVKSIKKDKTQAKKYVIQFLDWINLPNGDKYNEWSSALLSKVQTFVSNYDNYKPASNIDKLFNLFQLCLELSVIDLSNTAGYIAEEVFFALANKIKEQKLGEEYWNPYNKNYNPLFIALKGKTEETILNKEIETLNLNLSKNEKTTEQEKEIINSIQRLLPDVVKQILEYFRNFINNTVGNVIEKLDKSIKLYNAYTVGFINGVIDLIASIVEAIGFAISLFNYDTLALLIDNIVYFVNTISWDTIKVIIKKNLKTLFKFLDGDTIYQSAYEFGVFIPKLLEIILDVIGLVKGAAKAAKSINDIIQALKKELIKINNTIKALETALKLRKISKQLLSQLKSKGIGIDVRLLPSNQLNTGIPTKFFDGKKITVSYKNQTLEVFYDEKKAADYLDKLNTNKKFLLKELKQARKLSYGKIGLSKIALNYRKTLGKNAKHYGNVAVFEYLDKKGKLQTEAFTTMSPEELIKNNLKRSPHAEIIGMDELAKRGIPNQNVKKVYSELEPCSLESDCKNKLKAAYPEAEIDHTFDYPGTKDAPKEVILERRKAIEERNELLKELLK